MFVPCSVVSRLRSLAVAILLVGGSWGRADAPKPPPPSPKQTDVIPPKVKHDWAGLMAHLNAGEYAKAAAAANGIAGLPKLPARDPEFLARSIETIDALMVRGFVELQTAKPDAAEATFSEADTIIKDREIKKVIASLPRQAVPPAKEVSNFLDLRAIELANLRAAVILERLRRVRIEGAGEAGAAGLETTLTQWRESVAALEAAKATVRDQLMKRIVDDEEKVLASPHKRALVSAFHRELIAGIMALEVSQVSTTPEPKQSLQQALGHFEAATAALDGVFEATLPKGVASGSPDKRIEATVLQAELAAARCDALIRAGDIQRARQELARMTELHKDLSTLRKLTEPDRHPDRFRPLVFSAEIALADARKLLEQNDVDKGFVVAAQATASLALAEALPLPTDHPLRGVISPLAAAISELRARLTSSIEISDMSDAAAGHVHRALGATAPSAYGL